MQAKSNTYNALGLMSGTSLDGLDIAYCRFTEEHGKWRYHIVRAECIGYSKAWQDQLQNAPGLGGLELMRLHKAYGKLLAESVNAFLKKHKLKPDLIASHGHTVFHEPVNMLSFQLGDGAVLYAQTGIPVVSDFRSVDVASGGQGAPLVPIGDKLLFGDYDFCLNLGGIANISYDKDDKRIAYDICACNLVLNRLAEEKGVSYDKNGDLAAVGRMNTELMEKLNAWPYYKLNPPKSLDKEALLAELMLLFDIDIKTEDKLATAALHFSMQIAKALYNARIYKPQASMLVTGGGAFNRFMIQQLQGMTDVKVIVPDAEIVNFKEALVFAFLGMLRMRNEANSLASVTGADKDTIGGAVWGG